MLIKYKCYRYFKKIIIFILYSTFFKITIKHTYLIYRVIIIILPLSFFLNKNKIKFYTNKPAIEQTRNWFT